MWYTNVRDQSGHENISFEMRIFAFGVLLVQLALVFES